MIDDPDSFALLRVLSVSLTTPPSPLVHGGPQRKRNGEISRAALIKIQYISVFPTLDVRVRRESVSLQHAAASLDVYCVLLGGGRDGNTTATEKEGILYSHCHRLNRVLEVNVIINQSKVWPSGEQDGPDSGFHEGTCEIFVLFLIIFCLRFYCPNKINVKQWKLAKYSVVQLKTCCLYIACLHGNSHLTSHTIEVHTE